MTAYHDKLRRIAVQLLKTGPQSYESLAIAARSELTGRTHEDLLIDASAIMGELGCEPIFEGDLQREDYIKLRYIGSHNRESEWYLFDKMRWRLPDPEVSP